MIKNRKRKGFTIVELVIVIAVIAILAGVLIPTFAGIINRANQSADIQAVRQMNMALLSESVENKPEGIANVIDIVAEIGYDSAEKRTPASSNHGFYWHSGTNLIILVKNSTELIFPEDNAELTEIFEADGFDISANSTAFYNLATNTGTSGSGNGSGNAGEGGEETVISDAASLKEALMTPEKTGTIKLGENIALPPEEIEELQSSIECTAGIKNENEDVPLVIDLNGKTLTLNTWDISGNLTIQNGTIVINERTDELAGAYGSIYVTGKLSIDNVDAVGNSSTNIENEGTANLINTNFTTNAGYGFHNWGSVSISGDAEGRNQFISNGSMQPLYNYGGTLTVDGTTFSENDAVSYYHNAPIYSSGGSITLNGVSVEESNTSCSANVTSGATIDINGGEFAGKVSISNGSVLFLNGGKFTVGDDWIDFTRGKYSYGGGDEENIILENSDALAAHVANINRIINSNTVDYDDEEASNGYYSIIATTTPAKDENGNDTQKTTYAIVNEELYSQRYGRLFGVDMTVQANEVVTMYLNTRGFYVESNIVVEGTLNIAYGDIRVGKTTQGKITVKSGARLNISEGVEFQDGTDFNTKFTPFVQGAVTVEDGGTFYYGNDTITIVNGIPTT